jgi:hypothetical protein
MSEKVGVVAVVTDTVAMDSLLGQGETPIIVYLKVELVALVGIKIPVVGVKVPPVPVKRVQVPPVCSPVMMLYKSIGVVDKIHTVLVSLVPALADGIMFTVAKDCVLRHGAMPFTVY